MDEPLLSRRDALQRGAAATALLSLSASAGCLDFLSGDSDSRTTTRDPSLNRVPTGVDLVVRANGTGLFADSRLRRVVSASLRARVADTDNPSDFRSLVEAFDRTFGLDPADVDFATGFTTIATENPLDSMAGAVVEASWSPADIPGDMRDAGFSLTEREVEGYTVYDVDNEISSLGILDENHFVLGTTGGVEAVLDVESGQAEPLDDELVTTLFDLDDGYVTFASRFPPLVEGITELLPGDGEVIRDQLLENLLLLYGRVYRDGEQRGVGVTVRADSESAAERFQSVVEGTLSIAMADAPDDSQIEPTLDEIAVTQEGDLVDIDYTGETSHLETVVPQIVVWLVGTGGLGIPFASE